MSVKKESNYIFKKLRSSYKFLYDLLQQVDKLSLDDEQREMIAVAIAAQLRTLLYDSGRNKSVLSQLGMKDRLYFMPTCAYGQIDMAANLVPSYSLVDCHITSGGFYVCHKKLEHFSHLLNVFFNYWWNEIVVDTKGDKPVRLSRKRIVLTLCDKEGGAHLDPDFTDEYFEVNYNFGFKYINKNGEECALKNNVFAETTIAIAFELLNAISTYFYNVKNKSLVIEKPPFNIITISYSNAQGGEGVRFFPNTNNSLYVASRIAFDYYHKASYFIHQLIGYKYSRDDGSFFSFLTVDETSAKKMIVLRDDETRTYEVLQEVSEGLYSRLDHTTDSLIGKPQKLDEIIVSLSNGRTGCFDKFLSLQQY